MGHVTIPLVTIGISHVVLKAIAAIDENPTIGTSRRDLQKAVNSVVFPGGPPAQY